MTRWCEWGSLFLIMSTESFGKGFSHLLIIKLLVFNVSCLTGLESGMVSLTSPESEAEIQSSSQVVLRCNIDGHPR